MEIFYGSILFILPHIFINSLLSKELYLWEPSLRKRILLILVVWLFPVLGAIIAYKSLDLDWFSSTKKSSSNAQSNLSGGLLELDAIFNPGARHVIEQKQKEHMEQTEDVEEGNNNKPSI